MRFLLKPWTSWNVQRYHGELNDHSVIWRSLPACIFFNDLFLTAPTLEAMSHGAPQALASGREAWPGPLPQPSSSLLAWFCQCPEIGAFLSNASSPHLWKVRSIHPQVVPVNVTQVFDETLHLLMRAYRLVESNVVSLRHTSLTSMT